MDAIFSSKLYKISPRKAKISSALQNPVNMELVKQLKSYIDNSDEIQDAIEDEGEKIKVVKKKVLEPSEEKEDSKVDTEIKSINRFHEPGVETDSEEVNEESEEDVFEEESSDKDKVEEESETEISENKKIQASSVKSSCCDKVRIDAEILKGTLNSRDDTKGVSRILYKDDELWVYYQDKVNLNSVMEPVISVLNSSDFNHLEFNRLARSSNAIVFEVTCIPNEIQSIAKEA